MLLPATAGGEDLPAAATPPARMETDGFEGSTAPESEASQSQPPQAPAPAAREFNTPDEKPKPTWSERLRLYGRRIPQEVQKQAEEFPEQLRNFPERVKKLPDRFSEEMGEFVDEVPFPGAPPREERPKGWGRKFFLELPEEPMEEAEGFGLVPQLGYSQETNFLYGIGFAVGSLMIPKDNLQLTLSGTAKNQYGADFTYIAKHAFDNRFRFELRSAALKWSTAYFGEGIDTEESAEDFFDYDSYVTDLSAWMHLPFYMRVGLLFGIEEWYIDEATYNVGGPFFSPGSPVGFFGGRDVFLGGGFALDTRDNEFFPNDGVLLEGRLTRTDGALGADFAFTRFTADLRFFWTPRESGQIFAVRAYYNTTFNGTPPFFREPFLGGDAISRGYFEGRFRDSTALVFQGEYRFPIYGRLNAALFADVGQVFSSPLDLKVSKFKPSGGAAIGYLIPPGKVLLVRLELAASEDGATVFLRFGNPF